MKISVVTASYNSQSTIGFTLQSFLEQNHLEKEMLVIDGASNDATLKLLSHLAPRPYAFFPGETKASTTL
jgi:glycosyltransferase involved in cell wall biosynthesis